MEEQVLHLFHSQGLKIRRIAKMLKVSRNTVRAILRERPAEGSLDIPIWAQAIDWERIK